MMLNATGAAIWQLEDGRTPCFQIVSALALRFSMPAEQITSEVYAFIEHLVLAGLIEEKNL